MKVLIADDDDSTRITLKGLLRNKDCDIVEVESGDQALEVIQSSSPPDMILLDWNMPGLSGVEVVSLLRETMQADDQPYVIIISAYEERERILQALSFGADDYITKPIDGHFLSAKYAVAQRLIDMQDKLKQSNQVLEKLAYYDELTGVLNRRAGQASFLVEVERCLRSEQKIALAMVDIDHFKSVNDTHGHQGGDIVLQSFAETLTKTLRPYDIVCRYGGEEFLLIAEMDSVDKAEQLFERVRKAVSDKVIELPSIKLSITASFGVHLVEPRMDMDIKKLINKADQALYQAKAAGRNKVVVTADLPQQEPQQQSR